ncbi:hypothetical protein BD779DRAFT_1446406, partial [Infundibulicybe gibba]
STHNTRIERLWVEVGSQFARQWRAFFYRLERLHRLDRKNPHHLWLLQYLFLNVINHDCQTFQAEWNAHPISREGHDQSPNDMRFTGQILHGMYIDDVAGVHPDILNECYGTYGHSADEVPIESEDELVESGSVAGRRLEGLGNIIADAQDQNFHHEPTSVPEITNPFYSDQHMDAFETTLRVMKAQDIIPTDIGLLPAEWEDGDYPSVEVINLGRGGSKELYISLPDTIWRPRAILWGQAFDVLNRITCIYNDSQP